jgi:hypothetical protein
MSDLLCMSSAIYVVSHVNHEQTTNWQGVPLSTLVKTSNLR